MIKLKISVEFILSLITSIIILMLSLLGDLYGQTNFNIPTLLLSIYLILFLMKPTKLMIFLFLFISLLMISTLINHNDIAQGGYNTLLIFVTTLVMLASDFRHIGIERFLKYLVLIQRL